MCCISNYIRQAANIKYSLVNWSVIWNYNYNYFQESYGYPFLKLYWPHLCFLAMIIYIHHTDLNLMIKYHQYIKNKIWGHWHRESSMTPKKITVLFCYILTLILKMKLQYASALQLTNAYELRKQDGWTLLGKPLPKCYIPYPSSFSISKHIKVNLSTYPERILNQDNGTSRAEKPHWPQSNPKTITNIQRAWRVSHTCHTSSKPLMKKKTSQQTTTC